MLILVISIEFTEILWTLRKFKMNDILTKINILDKNNDKTLYNFISEQLMHESNDIDFWLSLSIVIVKPPFGDEEKSIAFLHKALDLDHNNPITLMLLALVYEYELGGIDDMFLYQIKNLHTNSDEINSMLKYVVSWSYSRGKKNDPEIEEQLLKESISLWDKHVWNYMHLVRLYTRQKRYLEINNLIKKALSNIQKIYDDSDATDVTDVNEYISEHIKGIYLTDSNVKFIREDLLPTYIIFIYHIIEPILNLFHFIKTKIFQPMNLE